MTYNLEENIILDNGSSSAVVQHPVYWFEDGSMIFCVEQHAFKIHRTLLSRHSTFFAKAGTSKIAHHEDQHVAIAGSDAYIVVDPSRRVSARDVEILLAHIYHDAPLTHDTSLSHIMGVLRVSSPAQLDFPGLHALVRDRLHLMFDWTGLSLRTPEVGNLGEALLVANEFRITSMQKALYYSLVTAPEQESNPEPNTTPTPNVDYDRTTEIVIALSPPSIPPADADASPSSQQKNSTISTADTEVSTRLMDQLIEHFTPLLFTPPATAHMACTDVFADTWMARVIQPALESGGVYKPLETLEQIKGVDWEGEGLCASCGKEKREEWTGEQQTVWNAMDGWLGLGGLPHPV